MQPAKTLTWGGEAAADQISPSGRIEKLRERYLNLQPRVGYETALYWTRAFKESEGEPAILRRAKALKLYAENVSLLIHPGELIVGGMDKRPLSTIHYPDMTCSWVEPELEVFATRKYDPLECDEETKRVYREEIIPYWKGKSFDEVWIRRAKAVAPESLKLGFETCISDQASITFFSLNHFVPDFKRVMEMGYAGIRKEVEEQLASLSSSSPDYFDKATFYQALLTVCDGVSLIGKRYAELARKLARGEKDRGRKAEYLKLAEVCDRVPREPARTFHEAVQALYFTLCLSINDAASISFGRLDQYLYPWLKRDLEAGTVTKEEAQEILDCLFIKCSELQIFFSSAAAKYAAGARGANMCCVGGVDENGRDATNELSYMLLQAMCDVRLGQPSVSVLWHPTIPEDLAIKACQLASLGTGHPSIFNTTRLVEMLQEFGLSLKEARRGSTVGCVEPSAEPGKSNTCSNFGYINLAAVMEFALNRGVWRMNRELMGYPTPDPRSFTSLDQVLEAYRKQLEFVVGHHVTLGQITEQLHCEMDPDPYASLLYEDCIKNGADLYGGGARYNFGPGILFTGVADVINSLAAIKYLIFDKKKLTWDELLDALDHDFAGAKGEEVRQLCLKAPKYGNGDPYVDQIGAEFMRIPGQETAKHTSRWGGKWRAAIIPLSTIHPFGLVTGALPGGRKAGEPLAEGCSPKQGTDTIGPTAVVMSVTSLDHSSFLDGTQLNMKFSPWALKERSGLMNMAALVKTFISRGGYHIQFNVVSKETLIAAQQRPEEYKGLTLRVSGYNAYFTTLCREAQDELIARTEHAVTI